MGTTENCLGCKRYTKCSDPKKGPRYSCRKFLSLRETISRGEAEKLFQELTRRIDTDEKVEQFDDDFDIVSLVNSAYDWDTKTVRDLVVDDRDLPKATNFYDFCTNFLSPTSKMPFARQMWLGYQLLAEYCPICSDPKWRNIRNVPVDYPSADIPEHVQFLVNGVCPKCKATKSALAKEQKINIYTELDVLAGQRGGKSAFTATLSSYITHLHLKNPRLSSVCAGIQESTPLTATFVGIRFEDAHKLLWTPILEILDASPWFKDYHGLLDHYGKKYGREILKKRDLFIRYSHKNIDLFPMSSNKRALRGRTRFLGAVDEIGWFPINPNAKVDDDAGDGNADRERADGEEVYVSLDRSLFTVRAEVHRLIYEKGINTIPTGINALISSPASKKDKICRLVAQNKTSKSALAVHLPTWEMNPFYPESHPIIQKAYADNRVRAERDYGANPPMSVNPYMPNPEVGRNFVGLNRALIRVVEKDIAGTLYRGAVLSKSSPLPEMDPSIMALDAGYSNNSFAVVILYRDGIRVRVPVLLEVQPTQSSVVHYNALYKGVLEPLISQFNVQLLLADRWQSLALLHRAQEELKIAASVYSVKRRDFDLLKSKMDSGEFILPKLEDDIPDEVAILDYPSAFTSKPAAHLLFQMRTVKDVGRTVDKGDGYTDDLFRALVLGNCKAFDPKVEKLLAEKRKKTRKSVALGSVSGLALGNLTNSKVLVPTGNPIPKIASFKRLGR